jgi:hypothetical protein
MKARVFVMALGLMLACAGSAFSQPTSHDVAIEELFKVIGIEKQMVAGVDNMADVLTQSNPAMAPFRDVISEWAKKYLTWETMGKELAKLYKQKFSEAEVRELIAFYKTPLGQKVLTTMPDLMQAGMEIGRKIGEEHSFELQLMIAAKMKDLEAQKKKP